MDNILCLSEHWLSLKDSRKLANHQVIIDLFFYKGIIVDRFMSAMIICNGTEETRAEKNKTHTHSGKILGPIFSWLVNAIVEAILHCHSSRCVIDWPPSDMGDN